ncbi:hypothetical protein PISMIDRAFT_533735 [Pisolithus microcarpus 441]|uniref:Secreted protein n=1 Tax=Pisolithus microcarpus 441 TaxID=765257 RepID=A0A0C9ZH29_9AGAM|nr:hypothetical protein PISMIDRAFT_533735 [Pisolithus microcarpus 441]
MIWSLTLTLMRIRMATLDRMELCHHALARCASGRWLYPSSTDNRPPFNALLLVQQPNGEYKRVAAENEIVVSGLGTNTTHKNIWAQVPEIL